MVERREYESESEWVAGLCGGEEGAYELLLDRYEGGLYRFFYCSHGRHEMARDQCGETLRIFVGSVKRMRWESDGGVRAFVFGIARNVMRRGWREKKKWGGEGSGGVSCVGGGVGCVEDVAGNEASVVREVGGREEVARVVAAIGDLGEPVGEIMLLRFVEGFGVNEIGRVMGMPIGTVKSHIHRGRKRLCKALGVGRDGETGEEQ